MENEMELENFETNVVDALLGAAAFCTEEKLRQVRIIRNEREIFSFKIHGLTEDEFARCRRQNTRNRGRRDEDVNGSRFTAQLIYEATVAEDKKLLWQNHEVWQKLNVASGVDVILKVLTPAEKTKIVETIEAISLLDDNLDELIKNV